MKEKLFQVWATRPQTSMKLELLCCKDYSTDSSQNANELRWINDYNYLIEKQVISVLWNIFEVYSYRMEDSMSLRYPRRGTLIGLSILLLSLVFSFYLLPKHLQPWMESCAVSRNRVAARAFGELKDEGVRAHMAGRYEDAERLMIETMNSAIDLYGSKDLLVAECAFNLASLYEKQKKHQLARQYFNQSIAISSKKYRLPAFMTESKILLRISMNGLMYKEYEIAIEYARRAIDVFESSKPEDKSLLLDPLFIIAESYEDQKNPQREEAIRKRIITINKELVVSAELALFDSLHHYSSLLYNTKKYDEAQDPAQQCLAIADIYRDATGEKFQRMLELYPHAPGPTEKSKK